MRERVSSIYDLAAETGVSYATVSRALNGRGRVSPEAKKKVLDAARKFNFRPKMQARRMSVALVLRPFHLNDDYYVPLLSALMSQLSFQDISLELYSEHNINTLNDSIHDAIIGASWDGKSEGAVERADSKIPKIMLNDISLKGCSAVASDHYQCGELAAEHLLSKGHRRAGFIICGISDWGNSERLRGFKERLEKDGFPLEPRLFCDLTAMSTADAAERLKQEKATAVFWARESDAPEFYNAVRRAGMKIPDDLSVISMELKCFSQYMSPPMTVISQPMTGIAEAAVEMLMRQISAGKPEKPEIILLKNTITERESVIVRENV